jgi:assimilatory nitrate reductase electron transfer subunit
VSRHRVVVLGHGMAGSRFVQELVARDVDRRCDITVIGDETGEPYNRMQLSNVLAGVTGAGSVSLVHTGWYVEHEVRVLDRSRAAAIDRDRQMVVLADGRCITYDELVLATGSDAVLPRLDGLVSDAGLVRGAALFRTLDDCERIDGWAAAAGTAVVLGGGVLGVEAARALAGRGLQVTVVQRGPHIMERQLDPEAGRVLGRSLQALGIRVATGHGAATIEADGDAVSAVVLDDGSRLPCELLVLCCGVRPRTALAAAAGLRVDRGVVVDDHLRSVDDPRVRAIGECAEHRGIVHGLVAPCWEQAAVAAGLVAGRGGPGYSGSRVVTRLKAAGLELATMGDTADDDTAEIVRFSDSGRGVYQKLVVRDGRLTGAILLGDTRTVGTVMQAYDRCAVLPPDRAGLLMVRRNMSSSATDSPVTLPAAATVCQCNGVTKAALVTAWERGARSVADLAGRTRATTGCGTCREVVSGLAEWLAESDPA